MDFVIEDILRVISGQQDHTIKTIHDGRAFAVRIDDASMGNTETINVAFKTPTGFNVHTNINFSSRGRSHLNFYEDANWSGGTGSATTTQFTPINRNRQSSNTCHLEDQYTESGTWAVGKVSLNVSGLTGEIIGGSYNFADYGVGLNNFMLGHFILKTGTNYGIELVADEATNGGEISAIMEEMSGDKYTESD